MYNFLNLSLILFLFVGFSSDQQQVIPKNKKVQFQQLINQELRRDQCKFTLVQVENNKQQNTFSGIQNRGNWALRHKTKPFRIEKKGNNVYMSINSNTETLSTEQFGIISPLEHLELVCAGWDTVRQLPNETINNKNTKHIVVTINERKLARILKKRFKISQASDLSPYLSEKVKVTYDLYYLPKTKELVKFFTKISSSSDQRRACKLIYLF